MSTVCLQFKKYNPDNPRKPPKTKLHLDNLCQPSAIPVLKQNLPALSPQRKPTSFQELSGSRQKNKIFSGKKIALENKLNTLRSGENQKKNQNIKHGFDTSDEKFRTGEFDSGKKEGLFMRLLTSRSPNHVKKGHADQSNGSVNTTNDSNGISFSAFRGINLGENQNYGNLVLQKKSQSEKQDKGLKFRAFPHKKPSGSGAQTAGKPKTVASPLTMLSQGPLISQKGRSRSKSQKNDTVKSPLKQAYHEKDRPQVMHRRESISNAEEQYGFIISERVGKLPLDIRESNEVIRSRDGSIAFDMSPTLI